MTEDGNERVLILIPCSLSKNITEYSNDNNQEEFADPIPGIEKIVILGYGLMQLR